jgi:hypothetical protein
VPQFIPPGQLVAGVHGCRPQTFGWPPAPHAKPAEQGTPFEQSITPPQPSE